VLSVIRHAVVGSITETDSDAIAIGVLTVNVSANPPEVKFRSSGHPVADETPTSNAHLPL